MQELGKNVNCGMPWFILLPGLEKIFFFLGTWVKGLKFSVKFAMLQLQNYKNNKTNA